MAEWRKQLGEVAGEGKPTIRNSLFISIAMRPRIRLRTHAWESYCTFSNEKGQVNDSERANAVVELSAYARVV